MGHAEISGSCRARCGQSRSLSIMDVSGYVRLLEAPDFGNAEAAAVVVVTSLKINARELVVSLIGIFLRMGEGRRR